MWFLNPLFWFGIAAVAAPILVHLVRRTRARKVEFPALIFVRQVPQRTIRRRTLRNLLLLHSSLPGNLADRPRLYQTILHRPQRRERERLRPEPP